jgi:hypothetical protein
MKRSSIFQIAYLILLYPSLVYGQVDNVGPGRALQFDGVDDYIDLGNVYDDLSFPFTISAWIFIDPSQASPGGIFDSQNTFDTHYNGFWFAASPSAIALEYGDGKGTNNPQFRRGKGAVGLSIAGRWNHVSAVVNGIADLDLYLNGYNIGGSLAGGSSFPMVSSFPDDDAHIGNHFINGIHYHFKGMIDELRIFDRAVSEIEIRQDMCRSLKGTEPGLIGYWTFDEEEGSSLKDSSPYGFDGTLVGNPIRVFSGAPIGDESSFLYTNNWSGAILTESAITVEDVSGNPFGIHIYKVNDSPSQLLGLGASASANPYYGIFIADQNDGNTFAIGFNGSCESFYRDDNSQPAWIASNQLTGIADRREIVLQTADQILAVSLGEDQTICDKTWQILSTDLSDTAGKDFLWSTGETSPSITATESGLHSVTVTDGCLTAKDSIILSFLKSPTAFSLGDDELLCDTVDRNLRPAVDESFEWTWSDGSKEKSLRVADFGIYWLKVENACGSAVDSIRFSKIDFDPDLIPNCISPNGDAFNQHFNLPSALSGNPLSIYNRWGKEVYRSASYRNTWDAAGLASGIYYYILVTTCTPHLMGTIHVLR